MLGTITLSIAAPLACHRWLSAMSPALKLFLTSGAVSKVQGVLLTRQLSLGTTSGEEKQLQVPFTEGEGLGAFGDFTPTAASEL